MHRAANRLQEDQLRTLIIKNDILELNPSMDCQTGNAMAAVQSVKWGVQLTMCTVSFCGIVGSARLV
jgi:hypothetical protein